MLHHLDEAAPAFAVELLLVVKTFAEVPGSRRSRWDQNIFFSIRIFGRVGGYVPAFAGERNYTLRKVVSIF
jgi:hypothetical protein